MGSIAARHARRVLEHVERIVGIELVVAAQALEERMTLLPGRQPGAGVANALERVRTRVPRLLSDREPSADLEAAAGLVRDGAFVDLVSANLSRF
jgi:histidine ammonia-lyase